MMAKTKSLGTRIGEAVDMATHKVQEMGTSLVNKAETAASGRENRSGKDANHGQAESARRHGERETQGEGRRSLGAVQSLGKAKRTVKSRTRAVEADAKKVLGRQPAPRRER